MSEAVATHQPCAYCGSSDGATIYTDHTYCFVCEHYEAAERRAVKSTSKKLAVIPLDEMEIRDIKARGLTATTCRKYGYFVSKDDYGNPIQVANYCGDDGVVLFQKTRDKDKNFRMRGTKSPRFYGQHLFSGGWKLVVTEGEIDCLTVSQIQDNKYPCVSIPFGTGCAHDVFIENLEWLEKFEEVIVMFDMDAPGRKAVEKVSGLLSPHKLKIAKLPLKDPNECLLQGRADEVIKAIWRAEEYRPDGIRNAKDLKADFFATPLDESFFFPWCDGLNKKTRGIRKGEITMLTAGSGIGKSTVARELAYKLHMQDGLKLGMVMLEENNRKTLRDILSIHMQKPLHLLWETIDKAEVDKAFDEVFDSGGFILHDHFGSLEGDNLLAKIRHMIVGESCDFIVLDHITIAVSGLDDVGSNERQIIDKLMTKLRSLAEETGAGIIVISHLRKTDSKSTSHEEGGTISLDDLRGSGALKQLSDTILALERNQQADDEDTKHVLKLRVLKCRFTGDTGLAGYVKFDKSKNILIDVPEDELPTRKGDKAEDYGF